MPSYRAGVVGKSLEKQEAWEDGSLSKKEHLLLKCHQEKSNTKEPGMAVCVCDLST